MHIGSSLSDSFKVENGVPQGSVISPFLFLIAINDLYLENVSFSIFADDTAIWKASKNVQFLNKVIQRALNAVKVWCDDWGLSSQKLKLKWWFLAKPVNIKWICFSMVKSYLVPQMLSSWVWYLIPSLLGNLILTFCFLNAGNV